MSWRGFTATHRCDRVVRCGGVFDRDGAPKRPTAQNDLGSSSQASASSPTLLPPAVLRPLPSAHFQASAKRGHECERRGPPPPPNQKAPVGRVQASRIQKNWCTPLRVHGNSARTESRARSRRGRQRRYRLQAPVFVDGQASSAFWSNANEVAPRTADVHGNAGPVPSGCVATCADFALQLSTPRSNS